MKRFPPHSHIVQDMFSSSHKAKASTAMSPEAMGEVLGVSSFSAGFWGGMFDPGKGWLNLQVMKLWEASLADSFKTRYFLR